MDIRRLELLRELADRGSITAVARATRRTPSAVSQQLKILEREAGVPLTERSGRGIVLTSAGRALARTAADVATAIERAEALWEDFRSTPQGDVTLVIFPTGGQMLLPGLLTAIDRMPGLTLHASDLDSHITEIADLTADFDVVVADSPGVLPAGACRVTNGMPMESWESAASTWVCGATTTRPSAERLARWLTASSIDRGSSPSALAMVTL